MGDSSQKPLTAAEELTARYARLLSIKDDKEFAQSVLDEMHLINTGMDQVHRESEKSSKESDELIFRIDNEKITATITIWSTTGAHHRAEQVLDNLKVVSQEYNVRCLISTSRTWMLSKDYAAELHGKRKDVNAVVKWWDENSA